MSSLALLFRLRTEPTRYADLDIFKHAQVLASCMIKDVIIHVPDIAPQS